MSLKLFIACLATWVVRLQILPGLIKELVLNMIVLLLLYASMHGYNHEVTSSLYLFSAKVFSVLKCVTFHHQCLKLVMDALSL